MSGYLTRLAERALNHAPVVHANARLPFVAPPEPLGEVQPVRVEIDPKASPPFADVPTPQRSEAQAELSVEAPAPRRVTPPNPKSTPASRIDSDAVRDATPATERRRENALVHDLPLSRVKEDRPRDAVHVEQEVTATRAPFLDSLHAATRTPAITAVPALPTILAASVRRNDPVPRASAAEPTQPDVHIHIGRIELTAVPEPAPSRPARTAKKPMTLDEYLHGRGVRSS